MYTLELGLYPLAAIVVGALLTLIFFGVVRLKCAAHWAIGFIFGAMAVITIFSLVTPVHWVELEETVPQTLPVSVKNDYLTNGEPETEASSPLPHKEGLGVGLLEEIPSYSPAAKPFLYDTSQLFGWLWVAGIIVVLFYQLCMLIRMYRQSRNQEYVSRIDGVKLYNVDGPHAYSLGSSVFIPRIFDDEMRHFMKLHETAHVQHRHFLWLCLCLVLVAMNWYNPFCWWFYNELHLQQELQVDGDVLCQGVDRKAYQYSLLRATMLGGGPVWILSAFGRNPVAKRIAFMESNINLRGSVRRALLSMVLALAVLSAAVVTACENNEKVMEHPLMGWWKMDFTRNTDNDTELYPFGKQIAFYNYDTFLTICYRARNGKTLDFSYSTEEIRLRGDTLVDAMGDPLRYKFIDDDTFQNQWTRQPYQNAMPSGPEITDQWSRIPIDEELMELFTTLSQADKAHGGKFDGVWVDLTQTVKDDDSKEYLLISDSLFLSLYYHRQEPKAFRAAGSGYSGTLKEQGEHLQLGDMEPLVYSMPDADHLVVRKATNETATPHTFQRIDMPADLKRILTAPFTHEHYDYAHAKEKEQPKESEEAETDVANIPEQLPSFPGGDVELMTWLNKNTNYPKEAEESGVQGRVIVQFIVEKDGRVTSPKVVKITSIDIPSDTVVAANHKDMTEEQRKDAEIQDASLKAGVRALKDETIRVIKLMPNWQPGKQQGQPVRCKYVIPFTFRLS